MGRIPRLILSFWHNSSTNSALTKLHWAVFLWGFTGILGKAIELNALVLVWYRMVISAIMFFIILYFSKTNIKIGKKNILHLGIIGGIISLHWLAFYGAIKLANISIAMICLATGSLFTLLLEKILNKKPFNSSEFFIGLLSIGGVLFIYYNDFKFAKGIFLGILAAFLSALFTILNKRYTGKIKANIISFYQMSFGQFVLLLVVPFLFWQNPELKWIPTIWDWIFLLALSFFCTVLGQTLALKALEKLTPFTITLTVNLEPIYGMFLAFIIYKEQQFFNWQFYFGVAMILISVLLQGVLVKRNQRNILNF